MLHTITTHHNTASGYKPKLKSKSESRGILFFTFPHAEAHAHLLAVTPHIDARGCFVDWVVFPNF